MPKIQIAPPLEKIEQKALIEWASYHPVIRDHLFHIPNGGYRNKAEAAELKRQGVMAGVADLFLAIPCNGFHGLFIEMKRKGGTVTKAQVEFLARMVNQQYVAQVARGFEEAKQIIIDYLTVFSHR